MHHYQNHTFMAYEGHNENRYTVNKRETVSVGFLCLSISPCYYSRCATAKCISMHSMVVGYFLFNIEFVFCYQEVERMHPLQSRSLIPCFEYFHVHMYDTYSFTTWHILTVFCKNKGVVFCKNKGVVFCNNKGVYQN